jgi:hypothetical protein
MNRLPDAIVVSVDFSDILEMTLPRLRPHVSTTYVVTSLKDTKTREVAARFGAAVISTDVFYDRGASFNKGAAITHALNVINPEGWVLSVDADIVLPHHVHFEVAELGNVYGAPRLLWKNPEAFRIITPEVGDHWGKLVRLHDTELGGYFHLWHVEDPHLGEFPWHGTEWEHAGGYDTEFLSHWPKEKQKYLNMEVLHLGSPFSGWYGRVTPVNGVYPGDPDERIMKMNEMKTNRRKLGHYGKERLDGKAVTLRDLRSYKPNTRWMEGKGDGQEECEQPGADGGGGDACPSVSRLRGAQGIVDRARREHEGSD